MRGALAGCALLAASCAGPSLTEILVVVDTDLAVPAQLARVRFLVRGPDGEERLAWADFAAGEPRPAVLALVHRGGPLGPVAVDVRGERGAGEVIVERSAEVAFFPGEVLVLPMHLLARCTGVRCAELDTCGEAGCGPRAIDPATLPRWNGEPPHAPRDGGAECVRDEDCEDGLDCTVDSCVGGSCARAPDDERCRAPEHACARASCDVVLGCTLELDHAWCDDGVACTADRCDAENGCVHEPAHAACNDGVDCTADHCDPILGCTSTPDDGACDDGVECTIDRCDANAGCAHEPDHASCDDGVGCTFDACDPAAGCTSSATSESCPLGERCDTSARACVPGATFTEVYAFLASRCTGSCHGAGADGGLDLSDRATAYASLVGVAAVCGGGSSTRVVPWNAASSLLYRKIARVDLCGSRMPPTGPPVSTSDVRLVESWIGSGAPDN